MIDWCFRSGDDAWDYSATVKPSEAAAASAPAPKVATPTTKAARTKKKKKKPTSAGDIPTNAASPVASPAASPAAATATATAASSASSDELGKVFCFFISCSFLLLFLSF